MQFSEIWTINKNKNVNENVNEKFSGNWWQNILAIWCVFVQLCFATSKREADI